MRGLPEKESTIASVAVLLEPNEDNLYYGQNLWYDPSGFLTVGPWTLVPKSFVVTQPLWIPKRQERLLSREYILRWFLFLISFTEWRQYLGYAKLFLKKCDW